MTLTPALIERIVKAVQTTDLPLPSIAWYCGITNQTLRNWYLNGKKYKQQVEEGKIQKRDLNTKQKREMDLYVQVDVARTKKNEELLKEIEEIKKERKRNSNKKRKRKRRRKRQPSNSTVAEDAKQKPK